MADGITGEKIFPCNNGFSVRVRYHETYDQNANTSDFYIDGIDIMGTTYSGHAYYLDGVIKLDGEVIFSAQSNIGNVGITISRKSTWYTLSSSTGSKKGILHGQDGTKTITLSLAGKRYSKFSFYTNDSNAGNGWGTTLSTSIALTNIPRMSTPSLGTTGTIYTGGSVVINVKRESTAYTHTLTYQFGSKTGTLLTKSTGASATLNIPADFAQQIPNATYGTCVFTCETFSGDVSIGTKTLNVIFNVPAAVKPIINSVTLSGQSAHGFLQNYNRMTIKTSAVGAQGSTVKSILVSANGQSLLGTNVTTDVLKTAGNNTITVTVTDSRGRTATNTQTVNVVEYDKPKFEVESDRCEEDGTWYSGGDHVRVTGYINYKNIGGNSCTITATTGSDSITVVLSGGNTQIDIILPADPDNKVYLTITANDTLAQNSIVLEFESTASWIDTGDDGISATFGGKNKRNGWNTFKNPVEFERPVQVNGNRLFLCPEDDPLGETAKGFGCITNSSDTMQIAVPTLPLAGTVELLKVELCARKSEGGYAWIKDPDGNYHELNYEYVTIYENGVNHPAVSSILVSRQSGGFYMSVKFKNKVCSNNTGTVLTNNAPMDYTVRYTMQIV